MGLKTRILDLIKNTLAAGGKPLGLQIAGIFMLLSSFGITQGFAQDKDRIKVKVGRTIGSRDFTYAAYRFPAFQEAIIHYNASSPARGKLNYNQLLGEMHFIDPKGDTLALDNVYLIKFVALGNVKFYYNPESKSFGEEIGDYNTVKLLIMHKFKPTDKESGVAYNQYSNTSATTNYSSIATGTGQMQMLNINEYLILAKRASYFLFDRNNQFYPATKSSIFRTFSKHKSTVESFIKENRIDLQKEEDLKKLLGFCSQLT